MCTCRQTQAWSCACLPASPQVTDGSLGSSGQKCPMARSLASAPSAGLLVLLRPIVPVLGGRVPHSGATLGSFPSCISRERSSDVGHPPCRAPALQESDTPSNALPVFTYDTLLFPDVNVAVTAFCCVLYLKCVSQEEHVVWSYLFVQS